MRLIDADALLKDINDYPYGYRGMIKDTIAKQPTIEPKQGHWVFNPKDAIEMMFTLPKCSECGTESSDSGNYCPNCGCKMVEVKNAKS